MLSDYENSGDVYVRGCALPIAIVLGWAVIIGGSIFISNLIF